MSRDSKYGNWGSSSYSYGSGGKPSNWDAKRGAKKDESCAFVLAVIVGGALALAWLATHVVPYL